MTSTGCSTPFSQTLEKPGINFRQFSPRVDIKETDDYFLISTDLPGMNEKDIHVEVKDGILTIGGERKFEHEEKDDKFHRIERSYGKFF